MKKTLITFLALLAASVPMSAVPRVIDMQSGIISPSTAAPQKPVRTVEKAADGIIVTYAFPSALITEDGLYPGTVNWEIPGFSPSTVPGEPALPGFVDSFVVPAGSDPQVQLLSSSYTDLDYDIAPARVPLSERDTVGYNTVNVPPVTPFSGMKPEVICGQLPTGMYRKQPVARVAVSPVQYDYSTHKVRAYSEIVYKIAYTGTGMAADIYREPGSLLNPDCEFGDGSGISSLSSGSSIAADAGYLIISVPEFKEALEPFVQWKRRLGYNVREEYSDYWTSDGVKAAVEALYDDDFSLKYLLIVGDHSKVPATSATYCYNEINYKGELKPKSTKYITDFHYGCMDGDDDLYPDIYRGRWPVRNSDEVSAIVMKSIDYELNPVTIPSFYSHAAHIGYFEDQRTAIEGSNIQTDGYDGVEDYRFVKTCEDVREYMTRHHGMQIDRLYFKDSNSYAPNPYKWSSMFSYGDPIPADLTVGNYAWSTNVDSISNAINAGSLYLLYRGHGSPEGWLIGFPDITIFDNTYISQLNNLSYMPLIFSITCQTGNFGADDCFTSSMLVKPCGGTMAMFAQSREGYQGYNDRLVSLFFNAIWPYPGFELDRYPIMPYLSDKVQSLPLHRLGEILDFSINGMELSDTSDTSTDLYTKRITHCFADPSISFTTAVPTRFEDVAISTAGNTVTVNIGDEPAYISFYDPMTSQSSRFYGTEATYSAYDSESIKYVDITVSGHNRIPYVRQGNYYYDPNISSSRIVGWQNMGHSHATVDVMISPYDKGKRAEVLIVDMTTGNFISNIPVNTNIFGEKQSIPVFCGIGLMTASLMINGYPVSNVKIYVK